MATFTVSSTVSKVTTSLYYVPISRSARLAQRAWHDLPTITGSQGGVPPLHPPRSSADAGHFDSPMPIHRRTLLGGRWGLASLRFVWGRASAALRARAAPR
jgi:hypothetical protein